MSCRIVDNNLEQFFLCWYESVESIFNVNGVYLERKSFCRKGVFDAEIEEVETRLGIELSPQMRRFYKTTNGLDLTHIDGSFHERIFEISKIRNYTDLSPGAARDWIGDKVYPVPDEEYFVYGEEQDPCNTRLEYLRTAIAISDEEANSTLLINREVRFANGEWEIYDLSTYLAGAARFNSFYSFLEFDCESHIRDLKDYFEQRRLQE